MKLTLSPDVTITSITAGNQHACALFSDNSIHCWGDNAYGQLGADTGAEPSPTAQKVGVTLPPGTSVRNVTAGGSHSCALLSDNAIYCWGRNYSGELGSETNGDTTLTPVKVDLVVDSNISIQRIVLGDAHTCALLSDNTIRCWGFNYYGQLGVEENFETQTATYSPVTANLSLGIGIAITDIGSDGQRTCAVLSDRTIYCWGNQGSHGTPTPEKVEFALAPGVSPLAIDGGSLHLCTVLSDVSVQCWGFNLKGQLGRPDGQIDSTVPAPVQNLY